MNWYKKAQANIIDPSSHNKQYLDIGHNYIGKDEIWIWDRGKLFTDDGFNSHG